MSDERELNEPYLVRKRGMYYAHNSRGYTARYLLAELYTKEDAFNHARGCEEIKPIPLSEVSAGVEEIDQFLERINKMRDFMASLPAPPEGEL